MKLLCVWVEWHSSDSWLVRDEFALLQFIDDAGEVYWCLDLSNLFYMGLLGIRKYCDIVQVYQREIAMDCKEDEVQWTLECSWCFLQSNKPANELENSMMSRNCWFFVIPPCSFNFPIDIVSYAEMTVLSLSKCMHYICRIVCQLRTVAAYIFPQIMHFWSVRPYWVGRQLVMPTRVEPVLWLPTLICWQFQSSQAQGLAIS